MLVGKTSAVYTTVTMKYAIALNFTMYSQFGTPKQSSKPVAATPQMHAVSESDLILPIISDCVNMTAKSTQGMASNEININ